MSSPIGGFMPIPLAMMMPFMAAQSMLMGDAFGKGFQFGKRKISALSNEEFNKLDMSAMVSNMQTEFKNLVPTLQQSIRDSKQVQNVIIDEMIKIVPEFLKFMTTTAITTATTGVQQTGEDIAHALGTHFGHDTTTPTTPTTPTSGGAPPLAQITADQRTKLMAHYANNIKLLNLKFAQASIRARTSRSSSQRSAAAREQMTIRTEKAKQKRYLTNVTRWRNPY